MTGTGKTAQPAELSAEGASGQQPVPPGRVLLIEDEPNIATAITFLLQRDGWRVSTHSDGASAMAAVARHAPDVVVLDVMLPGKSGFDILGAIRAGDRPGLPVLMLTAKGQQKDRERAEALGVSRFMTKPFSNRELIETVRALAGAAMPTEPGRSDSANPGSARPDSANPDSANPDPERSDSGRPDPGRPDSRRPNPARDNSGRPDSGSPDSGGPDPARDDPE